MWLNVGVSVVGLMVLREVFAQLFAKDWLTSNVYTLIGYLVIWGITVWVVMRKKRVGGEYWVALAIIYMMINLIFVRLMRALGITVPIDIINYVYFPVFYGFSIWGVVTITNTQVKGWLCAGLGMQLLADGLTAWESMSYLPWVGLAGKVIYWIASGVLLWSLWQAGENEE